MSKGHQNHRPRIAAIDGVIKDRTIRVSNSNPRPIVDPACPMWRRSLASIEAIVKAKTNPAAVTTLPVLPMVRMMPVLIPAPTFSLNRDTRGRACHGRKREAPSEAYPYIPYGVWYKEP